MKLKQSSVVLATALGLMLTADQVAAQNGAPGSNPLERPVTEAVETATGTQQELDDWYQEKAALEVRHKAATANITYLEDRLAFQRNVKTALAGDIGELKRRLEEADRLQAVIQDTLNTVLGRLETVVENDLPFLPDERRQRLDSLARLNARTDVAPAEKLRRLLEAMLIEAQYVSTVEVVAENVRVAGRDIHADILRIGRLAMYWRTPDGKEVGTWDPVAEKWQILAQGERRVINRAFDMAVHVRPTQLISLPLGRIQP